MEQRRFADAESLRPVVRAVFGAGHDVTRVGNGFLAAPRRAPTAWSRTTAGRRLSTSGTRPRTSGGGALPSGADDPLDPFSHASGLDLFEAAARRLEAAGVRCPRGCS